MINGDKVIYANWCLSDNFGDKLTPYIVEKISGKKCIYSPPESDVPKYTVTGSILNWKIENAITWGCGIANRSDEVLATDIRATRGNISKYMAILSGIQTPIAIGDPALLIPRFYTPKTEKKYSLGIFPHYTDLEAVVYHLLDKLPKRVVIINAFDSIEEIINTVCSCDRIISSSLHGLIVSDAYSIPSRWVKFTDRILGDGTKYLDYYSSINYDMQTVQINLRDNIKMDVLMNVECDLKNLDIDLDKLYDCCPFKP